MAGTFPWTYHDWREQATTALQIARLQLHIAEVTTFAGDAQNGPKRLMLHQNLLPLLRDEMKALQVRATTSTSRLSSRVGRVSRMKRGAGA